MRICTAFNVLKEKVNMPNRKMSPNFLPQLNIHKILVSLVGLSSVHIYFHFKPLGGDELGELRRKQAEKSGFLVLHLEAVPFCLM